MEPVDTLICARWVLPVEPDGSVLEDHAVAIRAGRIVAVMPAATARQSLCRRRNSSSGRTTRCCPDWSTRTRTPR